ncbi:aminotransferase class I/II-fold pyridoxal phosphate-dependent enzyme [Apilactobacillus xinyiensis]|uniref:Aminotransferase n=1 Tax=Apilactobacillus xinyiensis TaxID=2841032 RepID=A0ABT0I1A7_9LACO|nr:aminotransferase class I/II-fold pyridoxal phosphate-dependent enzyme [Apilactobacillus xinyiensis]MCK8624432.1 aminotransferase class I/II-fold pyridoxal phosphate-dependent enzyme [Apilactobacillus xinyiensis]MCL0318701.1 aminotransferase class I/II-fold pyridoxal phosphate-dependent enzyme [Apilactobacillus xinyiensis]MCL0329577.1 aminotransferase class I/II-fold pyridoxal phosphate-dependent enzyme [Apilactobacillus xinyiensis]
MPKLLSELKDIYNEKLDLVGPSGIRAFDKKISNIDGIVKLTIGEPDLNTPEHVKKAAMESIQNNDSHYSAQTGKLELRQAIANYLKKTQNLDYDPQSEVVVTVGATEAIYATFETMLNPGDKVILPTPTFALYYPIIKLLGAQPIMVDTSKDNFELTAEHLEEVIAREGDAVKAILINYPGNPTGVEYSKDNLEKLANVVKEHNLFMITDEIYCELTYGVEHYSIARLLPEQTIYINGVSKSHAMTGYRIGYVCGPKEFMQKLTKVHAFMITSPSNPAQVAAYEALANGLNDPIEMREIYRRRRDYIVSALETMGFDMATPQGAFYVFAKIPAKCNQNDTEFALDLAEKAKVGVIPGSAFGEGGQGYIRLSYAASDEAIKNAMNQMKSYLA